MKNTKTTCIALALLTGSVSQFAFAGENDKKASHSKETTMSSTREVSRIAEDRVDELTTASDLIGASVYDRNGDKVGDIKDVSFGRNVMASMSMNKTNKTDAKSSKKSDSWSTSSSQNDGEQSDEMVTESKQRSIPESYANQNRGSDSDSNWSNSDKEGKSWSDKDKKSKGMHSDSMMSSRPEAVVFISVGGIFGMGDDLVQVPASKISYDSSEERFVLQGHSVDEVAEIAEADEKNFNEDDYYTDNWNNTSATGYGMYDVPYSENTARGMRDFGSDKEMIRSAFDNDNTLSSHSDSIEINEKDGEIVLTGKVKSTEAKQRAEELAKRETTLDVTNKIKVKNNM